MGKAAGFLSLPHYAQFFEKILGKKVFAGTLNARASVAEVGKLRSRAKSAFRLVEKTVGKKKLSGVSCLKATVSAYSQKEKIACLLVFPDKSTHDKSVLEIVAAENLRQRLLLKDGDIVEIMVN